MIEDLQRRENKMFVSPFWRKKTSESLSIYVVFVCSQTALQLPLVKAAVRRELQLGVFKTSPLRVGFAFLRIFSCLLVFSCAFGC